MYHKKAKTSEAGSDPGTDPRVAGHSEPLLIREEGNIALSASQRTFQNKLDLLGEAEPFPQPELKQTRPNYNLYQGRDDHHYMREIIQKMKDEDDELA